MARFSPLAYRVPGRQVAHSPESMATELYITPGNTRDDVWGCADGAICRLKLAPGNCSSSAQHADPLAMKLMVIMQER